MLTEQEKQIAIDAWEHTQGDEDDTFADLFAAVEAVLANRQPAQSEAQPAPDVVELDFPEDSDDYCAWLVFNKGALHVCDSDTANSFKVWRRGGINRTLRDILRARLAKPQQETREQKVSAILMRHNSNWDVDNIRNQVAAKIIAALDGEGK